MLLVFFGLNDEPYACIEAKSPDAAGKQLGLEKLPCNVPWQTRWLHSKTGTELKLCAPLEWKTPGDVDDTISRRQESHRLPNSTPNLEFEAACLAAYESGEHQTLADVIAQKRAEVAGHLSHENWEALRQQANWLNALLQQKPASERTGYQLSPGSILNAYREGDITFAQAIVRLMEFYKKATPEVIGRQVELVMMQAATEKSLELARIKGDNV